MLTIETIDARPQDDRAREPERTQDVPARDWPTAVANPRRYRRP